MLMLIAKDIVLPGAIMTTIEADVCEIVFGRFLGTDQVETTELVSCCIGARCNCGHSEKDVDGSYLVW